MNSRTILAKYKCSECGAEKVCPVDYPLSQCLNCCGAMVKIPGSDQYPLGYGITCPKCGKPTKYEKRPKGGVFEYCTDFLNCDWGREIKGPAVADDSTPKALFEQNAGATLDRVKLTFCQRGGEYGDTWRLAQWLAMKATGKTFGITLTDEQWRALAAGCLVDVKYWRLLGGYKEDTGIDGIAYGANWVEIMRQFEKSNVPQE